LNIGGARTRTTAHEKDLSMKTVLNNGVLLAIAASALAGRVALADELPVTEDTDSKPIVVAMASTEAAPTPGSEKEDSAVTDALESISKDNRIELDMRLSGHTSGLQVASR
jgi:hypothetical protein